MKKLLIFDLSNFIFRAFFAIRPLYKADGTPVNAVYGVTQMILSAIEELAPDYVLIAQDHKGGSFRNDLYSEYKANRGAPPEELIPQFEIIDQLITQLNLAKLKVKGFEADDIIGSVVHQYRKDFDEILIASSDKDLMQFVDDRVKMVDTMRNKLYGPNEVFEKMGVHPHQIIDYLSIVGDASDNVPGIKGIGAKGASKLLSQYETLENIFDNVEHITNKRVLNGLRNFKEEAFLSKKLVTIECEMNLSLGADDFKFEFAPSDELRDFFEDLNFKSIVKKIFIDKFQIEKAKIDLPQKNEPDYKRDYFVEFVSPQFQLFLKELKPKEKIAISFNDEAYSVTKENLSFVYKLKNEEEEDFLKVISDKKCIVLSFFPKKLMKKYWALGLKPSCFFHDVAMAHFNLYPDDKNNEKSILEKFLEFELKKDDDLKNVLKSSRGVWEVWKRISPKISKVYEKYDLPLNPILAKMEYRGIKVDSEILKNQQEELQEKLKGIIGKIQKITQLEDVNLKSPKQVGNMLFETLDFPVIKKTKTGYSTDISVLTKLASMDLGPIPELIIQFRESDKLLSTYVKALPLEINEETGRIHTTFNQTGAATGRLSSDQPNLQNIPIKSDSGRKVRKAFIAEQGHRFVSADYSQVELRILAHFCGDEVMKQAFANDEDIHTQVAAEVFNLDVAEVTPEVRSKAKAINFGLIYGQSSFGLAETLNISRTQAKEYITHYFLRFSKVKAFLDSLKEQCEATGYAETILGRQRPIRNIHSKNRTVKSFAERMAINTPIQGTAADIIKVAMINISKIIEDSFPKSHMILQVHDELIFETHESELDDFKKMIIKEMESAVTLSVPLKVDVSEGRSWYEL